MLKSCPSTDPPSPIAGALTIALVNSGARDSFVKSGSADFVVQALHDVLGVNWSIDAIVDPTARPGTTEDNLESEDPTPPAEPRRSGEAAPASVRDALREPATPRTREDPDASADRDDPVIESETIDPEMLLSRELGAEVIDESRTD